MMWSEKYRPKNLLEMVGNEEAKESFVKWLGKWIKGTKPLLLVGPPGIGKTTMAVLGTKQFGYDLISMNASDVRSKQKIQEILNPILGNSSVLGKPMIFIDEVDGIHGRSDFGGVEALVDILKEPTIPIILAANSDVSGKMKNIKKVATTVKLRPLPPRLMRLYIEEILKREGASIKIGNMIKMIIDSRGDIRSILNSAQALAGGFEPQLDKSYETHNIEESVNLFFNAKSPEEAQAILYSMRIDPREKINAFYSSIITSTLPVNILKDMLDVLSEADMLYGKIIRKQEWRLLRYLDGILSKLYHQGTTIKYSKFNLPWPTLNRIRWDGMAIKGLTRNLAKQMHVSRSTFSTFYLPYLLCCMKNKSLEMDLNETDSEIIQKEMALIK
ncbi:putative ATPase family associated with various cellular activities (AAA) [Nitrosotalea devaniterrae]|uniref:Putative ATPase family associated with various cellular activities (AAA) n=1 Tax=Nitrosotalea devaniterrae TaxID=1078905 RepID=A0A128A5I1_9ARCH|nr:putative ATPase family associated with various cellular activities (AAA) [Candidatus Nitrosotalea devanaterra]